MADHHMNHISSAVVSDEIVDRKWTLDSSTSHTVTIHIVAVPTDRGTEWFEVVVREISKEAVKETWNPAYKDVYGDE